MNRKYANDYKECPKASGADKKKREYIYIGPYYAYEFHTSRKRMLAEYLLLTVVLAVIWVAAGLLNNSGSRFGLTVIPYAMGFIPVFYLICGVLSACSGRAEKQERYQYDMSYRRIGRSINGVLTAAAITVAGDMIFILFHYKSIDLVLEGIFLTCVTAAAATAAQIKRVYRKNVCRAITTTK